MSITLRQLEVFVLVVRYGSFRRCAEELDISPVSVSEHIQEFERRLQCKVFNRKPGQAPTLTRDGKTAYERSKKILDDVNGLVGGVEQQNSQRQQIAVHMHAFVGASLLTTLNDFRKQHPEIDLRVKFSNEATETTVEEVRKNRVDLAFLITFDRELEDESELFAEERLGIVVARDHPLTKYRSIKQEQLHNTPSINLLPENPLRRLADQALGEVNIENSHIALETDEYELILSSLCNGMGYTCMFEKNLDIRDTRSRLTLLNLDFSLPNLKIRTMLSPRAQLIPAAIKLKSMLTQAYKLPYQPVKLAS